MDSDYLYIVATLTFISVFFIYFIYFQSRAKHTETDNGIECDGDKCFIEHKQNCQLWRWKMYLILIHIFVINKGNKYIGRLIRGDFSKVISIYKSI